MHPIEFVTWTDEQIVQRAEAKNKPGLFLPFITHDTPIDWNKVVGAFLEIVLAKDVSRYSVEHFCEDAKKEFESVGIKEGKGWELLEQTYFRNNELYSVAPEFLVFHGSEVDSKSPERRVADFFADLLSAEHPDFCFDKLTFIEQKLSDLLRNSLQDTEPRVPKREPYFPMISEYFRKDFQFLVDNPQLFVREIENFLTLYGFLYTSQLSLSILSWHSKEEPRVKPLYFLLENEKASFERKYIHRYGYKLFEEHLRQVFPILAMCECFQYKSKSVKPFWKFINELELYETEALRVLRAFLSPFMIKRELAGEVEDFNDVEEAVNYLSSLFILQFEGTRSAALNKYCRSAENYFAKSFTATRGRAGKVLVLSQDMILLLTNLIVGKSEKLRFSDLLQGLNDRGVFLDTQSQQELIEFYERIGNSERLSDSGDAVYVGKTI
ncbi:DNA phosphorothioation-dependent restriction protein DptG [Halodesulfovibrio aestuarii]|uniref:DNA phosphorothioation-dependent restriction protein DptG n=1 Tax=Halodesulfovibrio aestuarii TaxID=126333 RepID=A0A8G2FAE2_9BACT|nr:DNA phosphorothioation-dependent restriction protein DptG [Halodesulfovibrio aestuarii]SHI72605.1 DNA phosphorothioation-dependent restriction protein DptG [Halodesulfovibrio aestuarii]